MTQFWNYEKDGRDLGPFSPNEIKKLANSGVISPETLVWQDGTSRRVPAILVRGLIVPKVAIDVSGTQRDASSLSGGQGQISENKKNVVYTEIQQSKNFIISDVLHFFQTVDGRVLKRLHPQRYAIILLAILGLSATVICPILSGGFNFFTIIYQILSLLSLLPTLAVFVGNPREPMHLIISTILVKFEGAFAILWFIIILLAQFYKMISGTFSWISEKFSNGVRYIESWFVDAPNTIQKFEGPENYIPYIMMIVCISIVLLVIFGRLLGSKNNSEA